MKIFKQKKHNYWLLYIFIAITGYLFQSCDDNSDEFTLTKGSPEVYYVRVPNPESADSLIVKAYMDNTIVLVGNNLTSIKEMWFNDRKAILNSSLITDATLFVTIPKEIPTVVTDKIYMITKSNDTVKYDFGVQVPSPVVSRISNEYEHDGNTAIIYGDYFIDDPNKPLTIMMPGNIPVTEIKSIEKTKVTFVVPDGSQKGYINVNSLYGSGRSKFQFRDDRGMILDWDNLNANGGWRAGKVKSSDPEGISGNYVYFTGNMSGDLETWDEDNFSFNLWGKANGRPEGDLFDIPLESAQLKFEVNVTQNWSASALQMIFTPWSTTDTNGYIADNTTPRGLWRPWESTGSYTTDGWITVSFPLTNFKYSHTGATLTMAPPGNYGGLTFFVYHGGITGTDCTPYISIDNIRVVPIE
ncbi:MAG: glycan-binding surface protein [Dysgonamonadaceae bacterium]|nr:glycan-binding surface protein [Dysgonamonadaceae bacterium]